MIAALKAVHIAALAVWCAGLVALPVLMHRYGRCEAIRTQRGFAEFRLLSHTGYIRIVTPAAVIAVTAGSILIVLLELVDPWMLAKLVAVAGMVLVHAWLGHLISQTGEGGGRYVMPPPLIALLLALPLIGAVLWLVLAKPDLLPLLDRLPDALRTPQGRELPDGVVPI